MIEGLKDILDETFLCRMNVLVISDTEVHIGMKCGDTVQMTYVDDDVYILIVDGKEYYVDSSIATYTLIRKSVKEYDKLLHLLDENGIEYTESCGIEDGCHIHTETDPKWSIIYKSYSYGFDEGLLEMCDLSDENNFMNVTGHLTADEVMKKIIG